MKLKCNSFLVLWILMCAVFLSSCTDAPSTRSFGKSELETQNYHGFHIPVFPTAQGQLNYARSGFPDPKEKKAALNFVIEKFPASDDACGSAALTLAYMHLEPDYRFALQLDFNKALQDYKTIINTFKDEPRVLVKAHWYIGWIYCDILADVDKGLPYYKHIVENYPDLEMGISSPVPWVSLVYSLSVHENQSKKAKVKKHWASLSLLEIIRHTRDETETRAAFDLLWKKYRHSVTTGLAIRMMLDRPELIDKVQPHIEPYLAMNVANTYLAREIESLAKEMLP